MKSAFGNRTDSNRQGGGFMKIRKILAPTDMSEFSFLGVRYALEMARELGAEIIVYYVIPVAEDLFSGYEKLGPARNLLANEEAALDKFLIERFADDIKPINIRQKVEFGAPQTSIVDMAEREGGELIVMSTHGRGGGGHMLVGRGADEEGARGPCPRGVRA